VAGGAERNVEVHPVVRGVRLVFPPVARNTRAPQRRPAQSEAKRRRTIDDPNPLRPLQPDAVMCQKLFLLVDLVAHDSAELEALLAPAGRNVEWQPADA